MTSLLVVEDDPSSADLMQLVLRDAGFDVSLARNGIQALLELENGLPDLVLTDLEMPEMGGLSLLERIGERWPRLPVIVLSVEETVTTAMRAGQLGAVNYLVKPCPPERIVDAVRRGVTCCAPERPNDSPELAGIVGQCHAMVEVRHAIALAARSDVNLLLTGATGTGKEIVARTIHAISALSAAPFVAHNCGTLPSELFDSTLFGHRRGAFAGAETDRQGLLQEADGGMIFLDEIEAMPLDQQTKLLRVLDDGEVRPLGSTATTHVSIRFIAATNECPDQLIKEGRLREDLYYRLRGFEIHLPSLNERKGDVALLAQHLLGEGSPGFTPAALSALARHPWPGNVRELQNTVRSARVRAGGARIDVRHLQLVPHTSSRNGNGAEEPALPTLKEAERDHIRTILAACNDNRSRAARALGIDRSTLRRKIAEMAAEESSKPEPS